MSDTSQNYISEELTHFVGRNLRQDDDQYILLIKILKSGELIHPEHTQGAIIRDGCLRINPNANVSENEMFSPDIICFCDIPIKSLSIHVKKYSSFGLAFTKDYIAQQGGIPVHYIPKSAKVKISKQFSIDETLAKVRSGNIKDLAAYDEINMSEYFSTQIKKYHELFSPRQVSLITNSQDGEIPPIYQNFAEVYSFLNHHIFSFLKFFNHNLHDNDPENFYFEREWRLKGNLHFTIHEVRRILVPESYENRLSNDLPEYKGEITKL